ncbi:serine/threonine protein kinase, partial [Streptomyces sp. A7024]
MEQLRGDDPTHVGGYRLRARLGSGGMGAVYLAYSPGGQPLAVKVIRQEYAASPDFRRRFAREVAAARRVQGPYTAPVVDSDTEGAQPWLAGVYVPGPALDAVVAGHGALPVRTVLQLVAGVAEALGAIHAAGVVHRDLKPSNVLLAAEGPRVIDFGIARSADATQLTEAGELLGTPAYMAPEQITGDSPPGPAIDVFALGLLTHYAATGAHPYGEAAGHALLFRIATGEPDLSGCPAELRDLVALCLSKDPAARPSPAEVIEHCRASGEALLERATHGWLPPWAAAEATRQAELTERLPRGGAVAPS